MPYKEAEKAKPCIKHVQCLRSDLPNDWPKLSTYKYNKDLKVCTYDEWEIHRMGYPYIPL